MLLCTYLHCNHTQLIFHRISITASGTVKGYTTHFRKSSLQLAPELIGYPSNNSSELPYN